MNGICNQCKLYKKIQAFGICKGCYNKQPKWREYHAYKEREWRLIHKEEYNKKERERYTRRIDSAHEYRIKYYQEHRDELCQYQVLWRQNNKEKYEKYWRDRYARKKGAEGKITTKQWLSLIKYYCYDNKCIACGKELSSNIRTDKITLDHVVPLTKGGTHWPRNIQPICYSCNSSKSDNNSIDYRWDNGEYAKSLENNDVD
jgi:hypothetical protein